MINHKATTPEQNKAYYTANISPAHGCDTHLSKSIMSFYID